MAGHDADKLIAQFHAAAAGALPWGGVLETLRVIGSPGKTRKPLICSAEPAEVRCGACDERRRKREGKLLPDRGWSTFGRKAL